MQECDIDACHSNGDTFAHRFVVDRASKAISLTRRTGVHKKTECLFHTTHRRSDSERATHVCQSYGPTLAKGKIAYCTLIL